MRTTEPGEDWTWCFACERNYRDASGGGFVGVDLYLDAGLRPAAEHAAAGGAMPPEPGVRSPEGFPLGNWAAYVQGQWQAGELSSADIDALEALPGWTWNEVSDRT